MKRVFNFSAGPSMLPDLALAKAGTEVMDYNGSGQSVMEMSHRSKVYDSIIKGAESLLREVMEIPDNYKVLFLQGGASSQFAMVPMNLMTHKKADYIISGQFSKKAWQEASRYGECTVVATSERENFSCIPSLDSSKFNPDADYFHICMNNTIYGTYFHELPDTGDVPLVADISSCILSEPIDVSKFGVLYAGAQKNMAPAGLTVVIIREDLLEREPMPFTPTMFNYKVHAKNDSMYNTPPCFSIYMCKLVLEWIRDQRGGLPGMAIYNTEKSRLLYEFLDESEMFKGCAERDSRSKMNVTFATGNPELDAKFIKEAAEHDFVNLKGHRSVGGMRASIYNAMPIDGVVKLVKFMRKFEEENR